MQTDKTLPLEYAHLGADTKYWSASDNILAEDHNYQPYHLPNSLPTQPPTHPVPIRPPSTQTTQLHSSLSIHLLTQFPHNQKPIFICTIWTFFYNLMVSTHQELIFHFNYLFHYSIFKSFSYINDPDLEFPLL